jgi:hypothetical protein
VSAPVSAPGPGRRPDAGPATRDSWDIFEPRVVEEATPPAEPPNGVTKLDLKALKLMTGYCSASLLLHGIVRAWLPPLCLSSQHLCSFSTAMLEPTSDKSRALNALEGFHEAGSPACNNEIVWNTALVRSRWAGVCPDTGRPRGPAAPL